MIEIKSPQRYVTAFTVFRPEWRFQVVRDAYVTQIRVSLHRLRIAAILC